MAKGRNDLREKIKKNDDYQSSQRHHALVNAGYLFAQDLHSLSRKVFSAWRVSHEKSMHKATMAKAAKFQKQRRRSIEVAAASLFSNKEKYTLQHSFATLKRYVLHMKSKSFVGRYYFNANAPNPWGKHLVNGS